ncbi:MAG TPA: 50S ribosomal protein L10 [Methanotrichaceae archaeon]|nr:MAG: 50S ribosomal protein L10 [Methanosaeta sp. PtaU1.Bin028]HOT06469.1 50S ribosomal protein L10 [Methanotrichaceae archaeon]HQF15658.1 50S ribosomal protein L10 [Methanotrichaceae archaeon]HQI90394.1 50S ribosomal protein L10 [Methanotrichaceae archaeon]HQJ29001.1 50S ribosomal protein L10 [Methanotrichaceae archaeon]
MSAEVSHAARIPEWKVREVSELVEKIGGSRVVGVVGVRELPASDLQRIRSELRGTSQVRMVRNNIARRAIRTTGGDIEPLADYIDDQCALIFTDVNPFALKKLLDAGKRPMPIKAGAKAPMDIVVEAGDTSFSPGPMVGKLQSAGVPASIKAGKVVISQRTVLVKEGEVVSPKLAEVLQLMEIFPRNIGLELKAAYDGRIVFPGKDLAVDVDAILGQMTSGAAKALAFAVEIAYITPETVVPVLQRASIRARSLVAEAGIPVPGSMEIVLGKASANAAAIAALMGGGKKAAPAKESVQTAGTEKAEEEESKENKEEDTAAGLGSLFG